MTAARRASIQTTCAPRGGAGVVGSIASTYWRPERRDRGRGSFGPGRAVRTSDNRVSAGGTHIICMLRGCCFPPSLMLLPACKDNDQGCE